jgi:hypothetical protein
MNNNDVLVTVKGKGIFEAVGKEKAREFALELVKIGRDYDYNDGYYKKNRRGYFRKKGS